MTRDSKPGGDSTEPAEHDTGHGHRNGDGNGTTIHELFTQYYKTTPETELQPPNSTEREWGITPFTAASNASHRAHENHPGERNQTVTTALRTATNTPVKHVWVSTAKYTDPTGTRNQTEWNGTDLTFEINALGITTPNVTLERALPRAKSELQALLTILRDDLEFSIDEIVYNGNAGYRVTIQDEYVQGLTRADRERITEYVTGAIDPRTIITADTVHTPHRGAEHVGNRVSIVNASGWGDKVRERCGTYASRIVNGDAPSVIREFTDLPGVTRETAAAAVNAISNAPGEFSDGLVDMNEAVYTVATELVHAELRESSVQITPGKTTDLHGFVRPPGSLHGETGYRVTRVPLNEIASFNALRDAVPDWDAIPGVPSTLPVTFGHDTPSTVIHAGKHTVPVEPSEYVPDVPTAAAVIAACREWGEISGKK